MKEDIASREDIERLVQCFYNKIAAEESLAPFFSHVNWEKHLPLMVDFWENALFYTGDFSGNPLQKHREIHARTPLETAHFQRWLDLFSQSADELFEGPKTEMAKTRAVNIANVMQNVMN